MALIVAMLVGIAGLGFSLLTYRKVVAVEDTLKQVSERLDRTRIGGASLGLSLWLQGNAVTDDLVVERAYLTAKDDGTLRGVIDVRPQPSFVHRDQGKGKFDLPDRELRGTLSQIAKQVDSMAKRYLEQMITLSSVEFRITSRNYPVANYKDGQVTLEGETTTK